MQRQRERLGLGEQPLEHLARLRAAHHLGAPLVPAARLAPLRVDDAEAAHVALARLRRLEQVLQQRAVRLGAVHHQLLELGQVEPVGRRHGHVERRLPLAHAGQQRLGARALVLVERRLRRRVVHAEHLLAAQLARRLGERRRLVAAGQQRPRRRPRVRAQVRRRVHVLQDAQQQLALVVAERDVARERLLVERVEHAPRAQQHVLCDADAVAAQVQVRQHLLTEALLVAVLPAEHAPAEAEQRRHVRVVALPRNPHIRARLRCGQRWPEGEDEKIVWRCRPGESRRWVCGVGREPTCSAFALSARFWSAEYNSTFGACGGRGKSSP